MEKFRNLYRIPSARAPWWDYSADGYYFITICTVYHRCLFGEIMEDTTMQLSIIGKIVEEEWNKSFKLRSELSCDAFVIMPNHLHAILRIDNPDNPPTVQTHGVRPNNTFNNSHHTKIDSQHLDEEDSRHCDKRDSNSLNEGDISSSDKGDASSSDKGDARSAGGGDISSSDEGDARRASVRRSPKSISSFVAGFKSSVTRRVNEYQNTPGARNIVWQTRFHDRIIRNQDEYQRILTYIHENPAKWAADKFYIP